MSVPLGQACVDKAEGLQGGGRGWRRGPWHSMQISRAWSLGRGLCPALSQEGQALYPPLPRPLCREPQRRRSHREESGPSPRQLGDPASGPGPALARCEFWVPINLAAPHATPGPLAAGGKGGGRGGVRAAGPRRSHGLRLLPVPFTKGRLSRERAFFWSGHRPRRDRGGVLGHQGTRGANPVNVANVATWWWILGEHERRQEKLEKQEEAPGETSCRPALMVPSRMLPGAGQGQCAPRWRLLKEPSSSAQPL